MPRWSAPLLSERARPSWLNARSLLLSSTLALVLSVAVLPTPALFVDILLCANLVASVFLLLTGLATELPQHTSNFPRLLILLSVLRLATMMGCCRLILASADVGVVLPLLRPGTGASELLAGSAALMLLLLGDLLVVSKGSERIAEVLARFNLDALPGRQMAIDADLRSGLIDSSGAKRERQNLSDEGRVLGAMDGALKFVRGDSIAALIVVALTLALGTLSGVVVLGLGAKDAVIRSLGLTTALAIAVRVPAWFAAIGASVFLTERASDSAVERAATRVPQLRPRVWSLELSPNLAQRFRTLKPGVADLTERLAQGIFQQLGLVLPACPAVLNPELSGFSCMLRIRDVPARMIELPAHAPAKQQLAELYKQCAPLLRENARFFIGIAETELLLTEGNADCSASLRLIVPKRISLAELSEVLSLLVAEQVSIRDLKLILEALAHASAHDSNPHTLTEAVRVRLQRRLTHEITGGASELKAIVLDAMVEETIRTSIIKGSASPALSLSAQGRRDIVAATARALKEAEAHTLAPVLLTAPDIRRFMRKLVEVDFTALRVVAYSEISPEVLVRQIATVSVRGL